jgi:hypothetical protein
MKQVAKKILTFMQKVRESCFFKEPSQNEIKRKIYGKFVGMRIKLKAVSN